MGRSVPNAISGLRIALVPIWLLLAFDTRARALAGEGWHPLLLVVGLVLLAGSDVLDGVLARRFGLVTNFGATLDALADKLAQVGTVTFLAWFPAPGLTPLPHWLWWTLLGRDLLLGAGWLAVWLRRRAVGAEHHWVAKLASTLWFFLVSAALLGAPATVIALGSAATVALVLTGTAIYLRRGWRQLAGPSESISAGQPRTGH